MWMPAPLAEHLVSKMDAQLTLDGEHLLFLPSYKIMESHYGFISLSTLTEGSAIHWLNRFQNFMCQNGIENNYFVTNELNILCVLYDANPAKKLVYY